jgi:hypothetical protein
MAEMMSKADLRRELGIPDTTLRDTLKACGYRTEDRLYPAREMKEVVIPARQKLEVHEFRSLDEMGAWAKRRKKELFGDDSRDALSDDEPSIADVVLDKAFEGIRTLLYERIEERSDELFDIAESALRDLSRKGGLDATALRWAEKKREARRDELRGIPHERSAPRGGLPYTPPETIDTEVTEVIQEGDEEDRDDTENFS